MTRSTALAALALLVLGCSSTDQYQGMNADQIYAAAVQSYEGEEWDDAIRALERLFASFAGFERAPEARMLLAQASYGKGDYLTARSEYLRFLDRYPGHPSAPDAALGVCRSLAELSPIAQRDQSYTRDAQATCRNVVLDYPGTSQAEEAAEISNSMRMKLAEKEFLNGEFYFKRRLYDSAIMYYEYVTDLYPETEWAPKALLGIYRANLAIGYEDLAAEAREQLLAQYPESSAAEEVRSDGDGGS